MNSNGDMDDGELRVALARLDERQKAADERATHSEEAAERALLLAVQQVEERRKADWTETQRRVHELNGSHETALRQQSKFEADYIRREVFDREKSANDLRAELAKKELEIKIETIAKQVSSLDVSRGAIGGKAAGAAALWGYLIGALGIGAAIASLMMRLSGR